MHMRKVIIDVETLEAGKIKASLCLSIRSSKSELTFALLLLWWWWFVMVKFGGQKFLEIPLKRVTISQNGKD